MTADRAPGWGTVALLGVACVALSVIQPTLLIFVPLAVLLVAVPPLRPGHLAVGLLLGAVVFRGAGQQPLWFGARGWMLLVAAWFLVAALIWPRAAFLHRALGAVAAATATAAMLLVGSADAWERIDWTVRISLWRGASDAVAGAGAVLSDEPWWPQAIELVYRFAELQALLFPALLGLASLAGLAVAWFAFRHLALREPRPLASLREFRFRDELVWLLILGLALMLLPAGAAVLRAGSNLVVFMGALYALRGLGVVLSLAGTLGPVSILFAALAVLFLYPLVMAATIVVGVTDTWLDLRGRSPSADSGPER